MAVDAGRKYLSVTIETGDHTPLREDEIVFPLRAQDDKAVPTIECYRELCIAGDSPPEHIAAINLGIAQMRAWQQSHPELVKSPD